MSLILVLEATVRLEQTCIEGLNKNVFLAGRLDADEYVRILISLYRKHGKK